MKILRIALILSCLAGSAWAQEAPAPRTPFLSSVAALRTTMLKLSSEHTLTNADGKVLPYNLSILDVTADAPTCTLTWKAKADLKASSQIRTRTIHLEDIWSVNAVSSRNVKMNVDPPLQIVKIHMKPPATALDVNDNYLPDGSPLGMSETKRTPTTSLFTASEAEATTVIRQLTTVMDRCSPQP